MGRRNFLVKLDLHYQNIPERIAKFLAVRSVFLC